MYQRRRNLTGVQLKISNFERNVSSIKMHKEILALFKEEFNFTTDLLPYSGSYGSFDPITESWDGMMRELIEHETDLGPYDFNHIVARNLYASPGISITKTYAVVYFWKVPNLSPGWFSMLYTFSIEFWVLSIVTIIIIFLLLHLTQLMEPKYKKNHSIFVLIAIVKAFLSQPFDEQILHSKRLSWTSSFLVFTLSVMGFLIFAAYTSCLTSILAANSVHIPFTTMDEFAQYDDFKIFSHQSTAIDTWLTLKSLKSKDLQLQRAYNQNIVPYKGKGPSHTEKWIASGYSARTGFIAGNGYLEQRFPEEAMFPGKIRFIN